MWMDLGSTGSFFLVRQSFDAGWIVVEVVLGENDRLDVVLKQFQRKVIRAGVLKDLRKKRYYEKPSEARQRKAGAARLRLARARRRAV
jgi:small subunit ribosomal protein S21